MLYTALDALSAPIAVLNTNGEIIAVNRAWRTLAQANHAPHDSVCEGANYLAACERAQGEEASWSHAIIAGIKQVLLREKDEFTLEYPGHSPTEKRWFLARVTRFSEDGAEGVIVSHENISDRKQAQEQQEEERRFFRKVIDSDPNVIFVKDDQDRLIFANNTLAEFYGKSLEDMIGKTSREIHHKEEEWRRFHADDRNVIKTRREKFIREEKVTDPQGNKHWVQTMKRPLIAPDGTCTQVLGISTDITERKHAQEALESSSEKLKALSQRLVQVQEEERRRIARELHDQIGQILTGLTLTLDMCRRLTGDSQEQSLTQAEELAREAISRVRQISLDLRPAMLDDFGLLPALLWHFERFTAQTNIRVDFKYISLARRFPPEVETAAYRIVQEALTNVARYAGTDVVKVRLWARHGRLQVQIEDQGQGFDPTAVLAGHATNGLTGMQERVSLLGGRFKLASAPGSGARIQVELSLRASVFAEGHKK